MCVLSFVYACNARCPNCPYTNSSIRKTYKDALFMDADIFRKIADECGRYGAWIRLSGGGEPMLHPQVLPLIEYAKGRGAKIGLITNGSRFTDANSRRLLRAGVDMIEFSVDASDAETYAKVRPGLDWKRLVLNVRRMARLRNSLRARTKIIASAVNQVGVDAERVAAFWRPIVDEFQKRKYLTWGINDPARSADPAPYLPPEQRVPCPFLFERLNIDSRGKVMMCGLDIAGDTDMGDARRRSIAEIWRGPAFERLRELHLSGRGRKIPLCRDCPDWKYRSWKHNYWKLVQRAAHRRRNRLGRPLSRGKA